MRKSLPLVASVLLAVLTAQFPAPLAATSARQTGRVRGKARPRAATNATVAADGAERDATAARQVTAGPRLVVQLGQRTSLYGFAVFSRDGRLVATGGGGDVVVWDVATGREVRRLVGNEGDPGAQDLDGLTGGAFSPDGRLMAVAAGPNLRLWNVETGRLVWRRENAANAFLVQEESQPPVAFTADGRQIVVRGDAARLVWDAATGKLLSRAGLTKKGAVDGVTEDEMLARRVTSPDGALVVDAKAGVLNVTEKASGRRLGSVRFREAGAGDDEGDGLLAFALSPDNRLLVTTHKVDDETESVRVWDVRTGEPVLALAGRQPGDAGALRFTADGGLLAVSADGEIVRARDLASGHVVEWKADDVPSWLEVSADGRFVVTGAGRVGEVWDARTGARLARVQADLEEDAADFRWDFAGFTPDETVTFRKESTMNDDTGRVFRLSMRDWKEKQVNGLGTMPLGTGEGSEKGFVLNGDTRAAAWEIVESGADDKPNRHLVTVWNADPKVKNKTFEVDRDEAYGDASGLALSPDGRRLVVVTANAGGNLAQSLVKVWDVEAKRALFKLNAPGFRVGSTVAWSPDGRLIATGADDGTVVLWDAASGKESRRIKGRLASVGKVEFSRDSRLLMASSGEGVRLLMDAATGAEVCRLVTFADGGWIVVDPQGRFDADDLADIRGAHWVAPDDPFKPLPLEIFMRDYYEPRLLARLLAGERFAPVRALAELNRRQPLVRLASVEQQKERPELVNVTIEVEKGGDGSQQGARGVEREAGVYDLRLFRDGQLVGHAPEGAGGELKTDAATGRATITFKDIRLPRRQNLKEVEFTAYAFNADRVKSETARRTLKLDAAPAPVKGRAYVVSVGVNAYENAKWDLRFAANDARRLQEVVSARVAGSGEYAEIVRVPLVSDYESKEGKKAAPRVVTEASATKANFRGVLDLLAGREVDAETRARLPNVEQLREAAPEDLVIISFSSHGYADERGNFYLLPYDTGAGAEMRDVLARAISSEELSLWLREVDAGELVLVVDACHSAASVQGPGFKPGPMGSRGLGQLSYDKGMRVLTSTQADNVALETNLTEQGLLTYTLTREGLEAARADFSPPDGQITVAEWLSYGVERVPTLFEEVGRRLAEMQAGRGAELSQESRTRVVVFTPDGLAATPAAAPGGDGKGLREMTLSAFVNKTQRPTLFDYARGRRASVLSRK
ncbi:MAG TPA: PQQ-binding-like beta-propeller repeat protein [Pyrinomonadaceae bacterium]